jgi:hypothetical protein
VWGVGRENFGAVLKSISNYKGHAMNVCILSGRLTRPPELRYQANCKPELTLRLTVPNGERDGTQ